MAVIAAGFAVAIVLIIGMPSPTKVEPTNSNAGAIPLDLKVDPWASAAIDRTVRADPHANDARADRTVQPPTSSGVSEMLPRDAVAESLKATGRIRVEASALMNSGIAAEAAEEIVTSIDKTWNNLQNVSSPNYQTSRTKYASDILFSILPDLPLYIQQGKIKVTVSPREHPQSNSTLGFTVLPSGKEVDVEIRGKQWDIVIPLQRDQLGDSPIWSELAHCLSTPKGKDLK